MGEKAIPARAFEQIERNLLNQRHPMIAPLIGCVFPVESSGERELKTV
jgi:hypothetical protein